MRIVYLLVFLISAWSCSKDESVPPLPSGNYHLSGQLLVNGAPYAQLADFCKLERDPYFKPVRQDLYFWNLKRLDNKPKVQSALEISELPKGRSKGDTFYVNSNRWPSARAFFWTIPSSEPDDYRRAWGGQDSFPALFYQKADGRYRIWMQGNLQSWQNQQIPSLGDTLQLKIDAVLSEIQER